MKRSALLDLGPGLYSRPLSKLCMAAATPRGVRWAVVPSQKQEELAKADSKSRMARRLGPQLGGDNPIEWVKTAADIDSELAATLSASPAQPDRLLPSKQPCPP